VLVRWSSDLDMTTELMENTM